MPSILNRTVYGLSVVVAVVAAAPLSAQEGVLSHFYGSGVHNYYERDYFEAKAQLSAAIDGGSQDPRAYYYRALANMRSGDSYSAERDLQKGAELESADINQFYPVGRALERVQGPERMKLERYRALARAQARQRQMLRDKARYEQRRQAETHVLRNVPLGAPPAPLVPPAPAAVEPPPAAAAPAPQPGAPAAETPFDAPAEEMPAGDSPFGEAPADEEPAAEPAAPDPFGGAGADESPFGDEP